MSRNSTSDKLTAADLLDYVRAAATVDNYRKCMLDMCVFVAQGAQGFVRHLYTHVHNADLWVKCPQSDCPYASTTRQDYYAHCRHVHGLYGPFPAPLISQTAYQQYLQVRRLAQSLLYLPPASSSAKEAATQLAATFAEVLQAPDTTDDSIDSMDPVDRSSFLTIGKLRQMLKLCPKPWKTRAMKCPVCQFTLSTPYRSHFVKHMYCHLPKAHDWLRCSVDDCTYTAFRSDDIRKHCSKHMQLASPVIDTVAHSHYRELLQL